MKNQSVLAFFALKYLRNSPFSCFLSIFSSIFKFILIIGPGFFPVNESVTMKTGLKKYCFAVVLTMFVLGLKAQTSANVTLNCVLNPAGLIVIAPSVQNNAQNSFLAFNYNIEKASSVSLNVFSSQTYNIQVSAVDNIVYPSNSFAIANRNEVKAGTINTNNNLSFDQKYFAKLQNNNTDKLFYYAVAKEKEFVPDATLVYTICNP